MELVGYDKQIVGTPYHTHKNPPHVILLVYTYYMPLYYIIPIYRNRPMFVYLPIMGPQGAFTLTTV